jgi:peptidoglycan/LPS O-acetylase OafA/YrhL
MHRDDAGSGAGAGRNGSKGYLPALDGLRAISVISGLLSHGDMRWLPGGFLGVAGFVVIRG